jgi:hypothetical protein
LQFTLEQLFERRKEHLLTLAAYREIGGVKGAVARQAEATYTALPSEEHCSLARALFLRLIDLGWTDQEITRRRAAWAEFSLPTPGATERLTEVTNAFLAARLLTSSEQAGTPTLEVSHEAVLREWPRLAGWVREGREDMRLQRMISEDAAEWGRRGKPVDRLYRGSQLDEALSWKAHNWPSRDEEAFLEAGVAERERQHRAEAERQEQEQLLKRRSTRRTLLVGAAGLALATATALTVGVLSPRESRPGNVRIVQSLPYAYHGHTSIVESVAWSPDGTCLASTSQDGTVLVRAGPTTGNTAVTYYKHTNAVDSVAWSPDGTRLASASEDDTVQVWLWLQS